MIRERTKSAVWGRTCLILCAAILSASLAFAGAPKISKDLAGKYASGKVDVIVQFNQIATAEHHQKVLSRGGAIKRELGAFKGAAYTMPASALEDLANDPDVVYISPDRPLRSASDPKPVAVNDYHLGTINASAAWAQGLNGAGIGVAVIDSGIANVADITAKNVVYSQDFTGLGSTADQYGHGTHVTGILAGNGKNSTGSNYSYTFSGIAPQVNLINLRALDENGEGNDSQVIAAIQEAITLKSKYNIRVINLSLGRAVWESYKVDPLCQAVEQAWKAGIVVVVAAGNYGRDNNAGTNGYGTITAPGNDPYVITVGAMNTKGSSNRGDHVIASYSSKGPTLFDSVVKPDLVAPGNLVDSLYFSAATLNAANPGFEIPQSLYVTNGPVNPSATYYALSGTSMATPMVSGAAALMLQQSPSLTPDQVKARIMFTSFKGLVQASTATDLATHQSFNEQADIFTVGAGYLDIQCALQNTNLAPATVGSAMSPLAVRGSNGDVALVQNGSSMIGGTSTQWGTTWNMWGSSILWGTGWEQGASILWGTSTSLSSSSILWGTTVSGESILWGTGETRDDGANAIWSSTTGEVINDLE
jgi:serine protease AprX